MQVTGGIVIHGALVYTLLHHVVRDGGERCAVVQLLRNDDAAALCAERFERLVLVQTENDGGVLHLIGVAVAGQKQRRAAIEAGCGGAAVVVPLVMQRAVQIDAGAGVGEQILLRDRALHGDGDALHITSGQTGLRHGQKVFVCFEAGLIGLLKKLLCGVQLFTGGLFLVGHVLGPASIEVKVLAVLAAVHIVLFPIVPLAVAPFAQEFRAVGIFHLAIDAGAGGPARERVAFAHQRAGGKVDLLIEGRALIIHASRHAAVNGAGVVADDVAAAVPLGLERHAAFTVGAEVVGGRHAVAKRAVRQHDVPVVIFLTGGEFGARECGERHMTVGADGGVRDRLLIAVSVKMDGQVGLHGLPERVERGVRRQFDCRTIVIDLFACGRKRPSGEAEVFSREGVGIQSALALGQRLRGHRTLAAVCVKGDGDILHGLIDPVGNEGHAVAGDLLREVIRRFQRIDLVAEAAVGVLDVPALEVLSDRYLADVPGLEHILGHALELVVDLRGIPCVVRAKGAGIAVAVKTDAKTLDPAGIEGDGAVICFLLRGTGHGAHDIRLAIGGILLCDGLTALGKRIPADKFVFHAVLRAGRLLGNDVLAADAADRVGDGRGVRITRLKVRRHILSGPLRIERGVRRDGDVCAVGIAVAAAVRRSIPAEKPHVSAELCAGDLHGIHVGKSVGVQRRRRTGGNSLRSHRAGDSAAGAGLIGVKGDGHVLRSKVGAADVLERHLAGRPEIVLRVEINLENVARLYIQTVRACQLAAAGALGKRAAIEEKLCIAVGRAVADGEEELEPEGAAFLEGERQDGVRVAELLAAVLIENIDAGPVLAGVPGRGVIRRGKRRRGHGEILAEVIGPRRFRRGILRKDRRVGIEGVACCEYLRGQQAQRHHQHKKEG